MVISTIVGRRAIGWEREIGAVKKRCRMEEIDNEKKDRLNLNNEAHICVSLCVA